MAVFTELSNTDLAAIESAFDLDPFRSIIGINDGDAETTYAIVAGGTSYILTIFETAVDVHDVERAFATMETLVAADVPCPTPVRTNDGAPTLSVNGKLAAIVTFVEGNVVQGISAAKCRDLGKVIGGVHVALTPVTRPLALGAHDLPTGPIHGAVKRENVFFTGDAVTGLINFRTRHTDMLVVEIAAVLSIWCVSETGFDQELSTAFLAGYQAKRPLTTAEQNALPLLLLSQLARQKGEEASSRFETAEEEFREVAELAKTWLTIGGTRKSETSD